MDQSRLSLLSEKAGNLYNFLKRESVSYPELESPLQQLEFLQPSTQDIGRVILFVQHLLLPYWVQKEEFNETTKKWEKVEYFDAEKFESDEKQQREKMLKLLIADGKLSVEDGDKAMEAKIPDDIRKQMNRYFAFFCEVLSR